MKPKKSKFTLSQVTQKDCDLIQFLYESKVARVEHLHYFIFKGGNIRSVYRRLSKLKSVGLVDKVFYEDHKARPRTAYSITKKALRLYILEQKVGIRKQVKSENVKHDLALVDIRLRLAQTKTITNFIPENVLLSKSQEVQEKEYADLLELNPDALIYVEDETGKDWYALEYEATSKSKSKRKEKIKRLYTNDSAEIVFYICSRQKVINDLMEVEREVKANLDKEENDNSDEIIAYALLDDVLEIEQPLTFFSAFNRQAQYE